MSKLSLNSLKERAGAVASEELLASISGGTMNSCHDDDMSTNDKIANGILDGVTPFGF